MRRDRPARLETPTSCVLPATGSRRFFGIAVSRPPSSPSSRFIGNPPTCRPQHCRGAHRPAPTCSHRGHPVRDADWGEAVPGQGHYGIIPLCKLGPWITCIDPAVPEAIKRVIAVFPPSIGTALRRRRGLLAGHCRSMPRLPEEPATTAMRLDYAAASFARSAGETERDLRLSSALWASIAVKRAVETRAICCH